MAVELRRRRFTLEEYRRMSETGILDEDERVELIEGEIVEMTPIGPGHGSVVARINALLVLRLAGQAIVWPQNSLELRAQDSQLQPDIALLVPRADFYRPANPEPRDVLLLVEVMDSSGSHDRRVKLPLYARAGLAEVWLVDVIDETVETCCQPAGGEYQIRRVVGRGAELSPLALPGLRLAVDEILG